MKTSSAKQKKIKVKSISKLKKDAWTVFSRWIRKRDNYICITCGKRGEGSFMNAGHYISRKHNATLFDERNVHAQCMNCNLWGYGNMGVYTLFLQNKYGAGIIEELTKKSREIKQWQPRELEEIQNKYKI